MGSQFKWKSRHTVLSILFFASIVSLVHPLMVSGLEHRLAVRRFEPEILYKFQLCRCADNRNAQLVEAFAQELRAIATQISGSMLSES